MTYTFFINSASSVVYQVYPLNWLECSLVDEKEKDEVFYRRKFNGKLTFGGKKLCDDFNLFYGFEQTDPCETIYLLILRDTEIYWEGYFSTSDGEWDLDAQTFTVTPTVLDNYNEFLEDGDVEYNILDYEFYNVYPKVTTNVYYAGVYDETYTRNIWLKDVIEYLVQKIDPAMNWADTSIYSEFFNDATNYVTGITNHYDLITIAQKSDIKRPSASDPATKAMISFKGLMEILRIMNLRWTYDGLRFTIEHVSLFTSAAGIDIRTQELTASTNKYRYIKEQIPKYEKFEMMESQRKCFIGKPIWYDSNCVNPDDSNNTTEMKVDVTTDIEYIINCVADPDNASIISDEGWVLLANYLDGADYFVRMGYSTLDAVLLFNFDLSWEGLHTALWKHDRYQMTGYMNGAYTTFYSSKKIKEQECSIVKCVEFDPSQYITTELGETYFAGEKAYVVKAVHKPYGEINLTLQYGPVEQEITPLPENKYINLTETLDFAMQSTIYAILSEPAPVGGISLDVRLRILDDLGSMCWTDWETITIAAGDTDGDCTIAWCTPGVGAGLCIMNYETTDVAGWTVLAEFESGCV